MASLYQRINPKKKNDPVKKNRYFPIYWVKYRLNGVEYRESTKITKKEDAKRLLEDKFKPLERNAHNHCHIVPVKRTLKECLTEYSDNILPQSYDGIKKKTEATLDRQRTNLKNFMVYVDQKKLTEFTDISEEVFRDYIQNHLVIKHKKKPNSVYKDVQIAKNFFEWAVKKFYCREDPTAEIRNPKPPPNMNPWYYSEDQVAKIFAKAKEPYRSMFCLLYWSGLRIQELLNVQWEEIDIDRKLILIPVRDGNKAKRLTSVSLNDSAIEVIRRLEQVKGDNVFLFTNQLGNQFAQGKIASYAVRLYKSLNIPTKSPLHTWRHTFASHMVQNNISLYIVKSALRHQSMRDSEIYSHVGQKDVQKAVDSLTFKSPKP